MAYIIYHNDGTVLLTIPDGEIDDVTTGLTLVGKNVDNYGQYVNNNFTKLLTNFAGSSAPLGATQVGQLWFDTANSRLKVYDGEKFAPTSGASIVEDEEFTNEGDLWYDSVNQQLKIWITSSTWALIGPTNSPTLGKIGIEAPTTSLLDDDYSQPQKVSIGYSYGDPVLLVTTSSFNMKPSDSAIYLNTASTATIVTGVTILDNLDVRGDLYVGGRNKLDRSLTASALVSSWLDPTDSDIPEAERLDSLNQSNAFITSILLSGLFPNTSTHYVEGSEVRVGALYSTSSYRSITFRHFILEEFPTAGGELNWRPYNQYETLWISSSATNIISTATF